MVETRSVTRDVAAHATGVFDLLARPAEHHRFDASAMVGAPVVPDRLVAVGEVFTMEMTYRDGDEIERYRTDNHVTAFEEGRCLEWAVAPAGGPLLGWRWRYDIEPLDAQSCRVVLTYDWTGTPEENVRRFGVPLFDETHLAGSLDLLAAAAEG